MGIVERKEKQKLEIRKMILDASMKLFVEEGFEKVSIRRIADIIEYSPTTIYLYFKDKNEILFHLCEEGFEKMAEYNKGLWDIRNPLMRLHKMGENYIQFGLTYPEYYDLMFMQDAPMDALEKLHCSDWNSGDQALDRLKQVLQDCMDANLIRKADINAVALAIWSMVHGMVSLNISKRMEKLVEPENMVTGMHQALHWMLDSIDRTILS